MNTIIPGMQVPAIRSEATAAKAPARNASGFLDALGGAMHDLDQLQSGADNAVAAVLEGKGEDLHAAIVAVEKADVAFQMMMQVRNKIVAAYQEISRMQF
jgi:flagellar hook-basal body complex protein FliE